MKIKLSLLNNYFAVHTTVGGGEQKKYAMALATLQEAEGTLGMMTRGMEDTASVYTNTRSPIL